VSLTSLIGRKITKAIAELFEDSVAIENLDDINIQAEQHADTIGYIEDNSYNRAGSGRAVIK
jgi:hypothetical protein